MKPTIKDYNFLVDVSKNVESKNIMLRNEVAKFCKIHADLNLKIDNLKTELIAYIQLNTKQSIEIDALKDDIKTLKRLNTTLLKHFRQANEIKFKQADELKKLRLLVCKQALQIAQFKYNEQKNL